MLVDGVETPVIDSPQVRKQLQGKWIDLKVYRESTRNRTAVLAFWVDVTALSPQHIWRHTPPSGAVFYEIASPFIRRVGMAPSEVVRFADDTISATGSLKSFKYIVIGDARIKSGLAAPYDEEDTHHVLKIERIPPLSNLFKFWREHANTDQFTPKRIELQEFEGKQD